MHPDRLLNGSDYARVARGRLAKDCFDYYEGGALDEITLRENTAGWDGLRLHYRVLAGVGPRDMRTTVLGQPTSMPIVVAPTAFHKLACVEGEIATAKAAKGGWDFVHPQFTLEHRNGVGLCAGRRPALVSALHL